MSRQGHIFLPSNSTISASSFNFTTYVATVLQNASPEEVDYISNTLYPPAGSDTPYTNQYDRVDTFTSEVNVNCNEYGAQVAFNKTGYAYEFAVAPGYHVFDVYSTFFNGPNAFGPPVNVTVATEMQKFFMSYAASGNPNKANLKPQMPIYGSQHGLLQFSDTAIKVLKDDAANERCDYLIHRKSIMN